MSSDKELRDLFHMFYEHASTCKKGNKCCFSPDNGSTQEFIALLERREKAARADELNKLTENQQNTQDMERDNPGYSFEVIPIAPVYERIKALTTEGTES